MSITSLVFVHLLCTKASAVAQCGYPDSIGGGEEVGSEREKDPSLFFALTGSEGVYCHKQEERGGGIKCRLRGSEVPVLSHRLFVCLSSHCRNQFALCGTADKERERLPSGLVQKKQQQNTSRNKPSTYHSI